MAEAREFLWGEQCVGVRARAEISYKREEWGWTEREWSCRNVPQNSPDGDIDWINLINHYL